MSIVKSNLDDGTLQEIAPDAESGLETGAFLPVAVGQEWPDTFNFWFACVACGERFKLQADTYHGSGGSWQPANPAVSRDAL
ncbi:MAG: hypothetical protein KIS83_07765 [Rubrivivax sp.]|nr:hypothetical protein [Rubrivivax sp.]